MPPSSSTLSRSERVLAWVMLHFRWIFVIPILLPLSVAYEVLTFVRNWIVFKVQSAPKAHNRKVAVIQRQIRDWNAAGRPSPMCTARAAWATMSFRWPTYKAQCTQIRTDQLVDILEIDVEQKTIRVEPMVTMGQLTRFLLPMGWTLPVVPELDDLTVGGMINGCGVESSSRRHGLFQHICVSYELLTADGELVVASKDATASERQALFYGVPWSHGTLALLVAATIRIIPAQPYVHLTYLPCRGLEKMQRLLTTEAQRAENDFVEGILFERDWGVVMRGRFSDGPTDADTKKGLRINRIGRWHAPWFFTHVEKVGRKADEHAAQSYRARRGQNGTPPQQEFEKNGISELIPLRDYYHRHSRSIFWEIREVIPFGNWAPFRWLLGWASPPKISLLKLTTPTALRRLYDREHVLQDMLVPIERTVDAVDLFHREVEIYPIWLCPFVLPSQPGMVRQRVGKNLLFVDVGVYGVAKNKNYEPEASTRKIEAFVRDVNGVQMLYADTYQTRAEFWTMFDSTFYDWLRVKYDCKRAFPDVYDKVCRAARY